MNFFLDLIFLSRLLYVYWLIAPVSSAGTSLLQLPVDDSSTLFLSTKRIPPPPYPPAPETPWIEGLIVHNRTRTLPGQAVGSVLIQSLFKLFNSTEEVLLSFGYTLFEQPDAAVPINVTLAIHSTELLKPFQLTRSRVAEALSILGDCFERVRNLNEVPEWDFDIALINATEFPAIKTVHTIALGSIVQPPQPLPPIESI